MPQQPDTAVLASVQAQAAARQRATTQATTMAAASARQFTGWYDSDRITVWAAQIAAQIEALQRFLAQSTDAYLARVMKQLGVSTRPIGRVDVTGLRAGVTHAGAYARAADVYRWQQHQFDQSARTLLTADTPAPFTLIDPVDAAVDRVVTVADMDAQLAVRAQSQAVMTTLADRGVITGFRRVIHPEQSRGGSCGLCVGASTRLYKASELLPIHSRCACTTTPVIDGRDPGSVFNRADLNRLYREAGGTGREKLTATRYRVTEHGELGPLLDRDGVQVRTARQVARDTGRVPRHGKTDTQKAADVARVRQQVAAALPKARELAAADPKTWGDYLAKLEARVTDLDRVA